jgi:DNA primase
VHRHGTEASEFRFTRRDVREATSWGDTQLKVHLARLVELEYVLAHRGLRGLTHEYELRYDGVDDGTART